MPSQRFETPGEAYSFLRTHPDALTARMFCGVLEVGDMQAAHEVGLEQSGYYVVRTDLYRFLGPKYSLVRDMDKLLCHEPEPEEERSLDGYASL